MPERNTRLGWICLLGDGKAEYSGMVCSGVLKHGLERNTGGRPPDILVELYLYLKNWYCRGFLARCCRIAAMTRCDSKLGPSGLYPSIHDNFTR